MLKYSMHTTQVNILKKMSLTQYSRYSDLKPEDMDPKEFTYHLKQLTSKGYITKDSELKVYTLTEKGKLRLAFGINIQSWGNMPLHSGVMLYIKKDGKVLSVVRDQAPFLNYTGILYYPTRKNLFIDEVAQQALADLGLSGHLKLRVIIEVMFKNDSEEIIRHACMFTYYIEDPIGTIPEKSYEGNLVWLTPNELLNAQPGYHNTKDVVEFFERKDFAKEGIKMISKTYNTPI
jgi:DNA-binding HxlR family transcriptional regulator